MQAETSFKYINRLNTHDKLNRPKMSTCSESVEDMMGKILKHGLNLTDQLN